jgi:hypothetical protein
MRSLIALLYLVSGSLVGASGCDSSEHEAVVEAPLTSVTVPPVPVLCNKDSAALKLFARYGTALRPAACTERDCLPSCGDGQPACPDGSTCDTGRCVRATCTATNATTVCPTAAISAAGLRCEDVNGTADRHCELKKCGDDASCPCGSYCDATGKCRMDCLEGADAGNLGLACSAPLQCDGRGRCSDPHGRVISTSDLKLVTDPPSVQLTPAADGTWAPVTLTVMLTTTDPLVGTLAPPAVRVAPSTGLVVACSTTTTAGGGCQIAGADWQFALVGATYTATRVIQIRVDDTVATSGCAGCPPTTAWQLNLDTADGLRHAQLDATLQPLQQEAGKYRGTLTMGPTGAPSPVTTLPVEAVVTSGAIVLQDPARVLAPTGTVVVLRNGTATVTSFLGGSRDPEFYNRHTIKAQLRGATTFDPVTGKLTGEFASRLASSASQEQVWSFTLARGGDVQTTTPCPAGETFNSLASACAAGVPWDPAADAPPSVVLSKPTRWLNAMAASLSDPRLRPDTAAHLAENMLCFDESLTTNGGFLKQTSAVSGDLACAGNGAPHGWWGIGLISYQDRTTGPVLPTTQFNMLGDCLQQLAAEPAGSISAAGIHNDSCVSLARFYPALFSVIGTGPYRYQAVAGSTATDRRSRLLFQRLLGQWAQLGGFVARDGTSQRIAADLLAQLTTKDRALDTRESQLLAATQSASVTYESLLGAVDSVWSLFLDKRIAEPLGALPPAVIATPAYRTLKRPASYWTMATAGTISATSGPSMSASGCTMNTGWLYGSTSCRPSVAQALVADLAGDLTVALRFGHYLDQPWSGTSTLIYSDGIVLQEVQTASGPRLQVGHRTAAGTLELYLFNVRSRAFVVQRDVRAKTYTVSDGFQTLRASYTAQPSIVAGSMFTLAANPTVSADFVKAALKQVAIWDSDMPSTEVQALLAAYSNTNAVRPAWPSEVVLPLPTDPDANESTVGLPVMLLEGLIPTMGLIESYVQNAALANHVSCRSDRVDDSLQRAKDRAARALRTAIAIQALAEKLRTTASTPALSWAARYDQALAELLAARSKTVQALTNSATCENPLGLGPTEYPLYFGDVRDLFVAGHPENLLEASAKFLKDLAGGTGGVAPTGAIGAAFTALDAARQAWTEQYSSGVQDQLTNTQTPAIRVEELRSSYGRELIDLCGIPVAADQGAASSVLGRFIDATPALGPLTTENCHIQETSACLGNEANPLGKVDPSCFRGQIGEAWLAARSASERVERARLAWKAAIAAQNSWHKHCAQRQAFDLGTERIITQLADLEAEQDAENQGFAILSGFASFAAGLASQNTVAAAAGFVGIAKAIVDIEEDIAHRKIELNKHLQLRNLEAGRAECWFQANLARIPVDGAEQDIVVASSDLQTAIQHARSLQNRLVSTTTEARAAVAREAGRTRPRIAFHYWADEKLEIFQRRMARARRMTYLLLRAVEHDLQRSFGLDDDVLGATHPEQLNQVATFLGDQLSHGYEQRIPGRTFTVLSLCRDVLRLPQRFGEANCDQPKSAARFRELLFSPANAVFENGRYLGQAIPFTLTPELAASGTPPFSTRCAEHLAEVDAQFVGDIGVSSLTLKLSKRDRFYSKTCANHVSEIGPIQDGTLRSSNNLLIDGSGSHFGKDFEWVRGQINALQNGQSPGFETVNTPGANAIQDLAGRGLYGDYALLVPDVSLPQLVSNPSGLRDLKVRFDFMSIEDIGGATPPGTRQLSVELRDGDDRVLPAGAGNTVTASCTACPLGQPASLSASAAVGWRFGGWTGACVGPAASCAVPMSAARTAWATFIKDAPTVALGVSAAGTGTGGVASGWLGIASNALAGGTNLPWSQAVPANSTVYLYALPDPSSLFTGWSGGGCSGTGLCAVTLAAAQSVTATFTLKPVLTINLNAAGLDPWDLAAVVRVPASAKLCRERVCTIPLLPGEVVELMPWSLWGFAGWSGDCVGSGSCSVTMNGNRTITAAFLPQVVVEPAIGGLIFGGAINCGEGRTACGGLYPYGSVVTVTVSPAMFFHFGSWTGAAASCGTNGICSLTITGPTTFSASFVEDPLPPDCSPLPFCP